MASSLENRECTGVFVLKDDVTHVAPMRVTLHELLNVYCAWFYGQRKAAAFSHLLWQLAEQLGSPSLHCVAFMSFSQLRKKQQPPVLRSFHSSPLRADCNWEVDICSNIQVPEDSKANTALMVLTVTVNAILLLRWLFITSFSAAAVFASLINAAVITIIV